MTQWDQARFEALQGKVLGDIGGSVGLFMAYLGDQCGIYRTLETSPGSTSDTLASRTEVDPRYLREWLSANVALGYVDYDAGSDTFSLSPEQAALFAHEGQPTCLQGFFQVVVAQFATHDTAVDVLRSGRGRPWSEHHGCCFCGTDRFFRPGYMANLVDSWIPALEGMQDRLSRGGRIADIGCGLGSSTLLLAQAYPNATVNGFDFHAPSIETARQRAREQGIGNARFETVTAKEFEGSGYDLVCIFDALHDMGDPVGAARHIREALAPDGAFMLVEPMAGDSLEENRHLLSGIFYGLSTTICLPTSRAQEVGRCLGAQAGEKRLTEVLREAGFSRVRRATQTPTNMVLEARV